MIDLEALTALRAVAAEGSVVAAARSTGFTPSAVGARAGSLAVASSAKNGLQLVTLSGTGMSPEASLTGGAFAATQVDGRSTSTLVLANTSPVTLALAPGKLSGEFGPAGGS